MQAPEHLTRRRLAVLATVIVAFAFYLSRASTLAVNAKGRPTVLPERLVAAVLGPGERIAYRGARGAREVLGAILNPRRLRDEAAELQVRADDRMRVATAMRDYMTEYETSETGLPPASAVLQARLEGATRATVIGADPTGRRQLVMLNVGAKDRVRHGMGLVVGPDLVGQVERVNRATSVAYLSSDRAFSVEARCLRSGHYLGALHGDGVDGMKIDGVSLSVDVREGDTLTVAPDLGGPPPDVRVGVVTWVEYVVPEASVADTGEMSEATRRGWRVVHARSLADLTGVVEVLVVGTEEAAGDERRSAER